MDKKQKSSTHGPASESTGEIALKFPTYLSYEKGFNREQELDWKLIGQRHTRREVWLRRSVGYTARAAAQHQNDHNKECVPIMFTQME